MRNSVPDQDVDLTNCDREPIHLPGVIQPFGFLIAVNADWIVVRASENIHEHIGHPHADIIGQPLELFLSGDTMHEIRGRLQIAGGPNVVERLFGQRLSQPGPLFKSGPLLEPEPLFNVAIHQSNQEIILEFEPGEAQTRATPGNIRTIVARLERHREQANLCREAARQVRGMTGFDRVMIYRFDEDGAGEVISESMRSGMQPFLGLHYPASDIPAQGDRSVRSVRRQDDVFRPGCHAATEGVFRDGAGRARTDDQRQKIWRAVEWRRTDRG